LSWSIRLSGSGAGGPELIPASPSICCAQVPQSHPVWPKTEYGGGFCALWFIAFCNICPCIPVARMRAILRSLPPTWGLILPGQLRWVRACLAPTNSAHRFAGSAPIAADLRGPVQYGYTFAQKSCCILRR